MRVDDCQAESEDEAHHMGVWHVPIFNLTVTVGRRRGRGSSASVEKWGVMSSWLSAFSILPVTPRVDKAATSPGIFHPNEGREL